MRPAGARSSYSPVTTGAAAPFEPRVVAWERLDTGQNRASARGAALAMVKLLES